MYLCVAHGGQLGHVQKKLWKKKHIYLCVAHKKKHMYLCVAHGGQLGHVRRNRRAGQEFISHFDQDADAAARDETGMRKCQKSPTLALKETCSMAKEA